MLIIALGSNIINAINLSAREKQLKQELARLEQTASKNQAEIEYKQSSDYSDRYAREHLDKSNPDEEVFVGVDGE
jgi:cell division protein FtsB